MNDAEILREDLLGVGERAVPAKQGAGSAVWTQPCGFLDECVDRAGRRSERRIKAANFLREKSLRAFDFDAAPNIAPATIRTLTSGDWIKTGRPLCLIGGSGTDFYRLASTRVRAKNPPRPADGPRRDSTTRIRAAPGGKQPTGLP